MSPKGSLPVYAHDKGFERALVVVAHPDDVDFGFAGTVASLTRHGVEVAYCLVTSGDAGGDDSTVTREERTLIRESEQVAAAKEVGVSDVIFLRFPDGLVEPTIELRREIARVIRTHRPDLVLCQSPERNYDRIYASHPDHMAAGEATLRAVYPDARNPHAFPDLLATGFGPHTVSEVWIGSSAPTMAIDITKTIDAKVAALRCHVSQVGDGDGVEARVREWARTNAKRAGLKKGRYAETVKVVTTT